MNDQRSSAVLYPLAMDPSLASRFFCNYAHTSFN